MIYSVGKLSIFFKISPTSVDNYIRRGMPFKRDDKHLKNRVTFAFDEKKVAKWILKNVERGRTTRQVAQDVLDGKISA